MRAISVPIREIKATENDVALEAAEEIQTSAHLAGRQGAIISVSGSDTVITNLY